MAWVALPNLTTCTGPACSRARLRDLGNHCHSFAVPYTCLRSTSHSPRLQPLRFKARGCRCRSTWLHAQASTAQDLIDQGRQKYDSGDRMGALKLFEKTLQQQDAIKEERQAALFNATCVHASFGDIELAQITLREGLGNGLDFEAALEAGSSGSSDSFIKMQSSTQMLIQLKKFARAVKSIKAAVEPSRAPSFAKSSGTSLSKEAGPRFGVNLGGDISESLSTDITGIDGTVGGIIRRVALLLVSAVVFGTVLFYVGLRFAFPEGS